MKKSLAFTIFAVALVAIVVGIMYGEWLVAAAGAGLMLLPTRPPTSAEEKAIEANANMLLQIARVQHTLAHAKYTNPELYSEIRERAEIAINDAITLMRKLSQDNPDLYEKSVRRAEEILEKTVDM